MRHFVEREFLALLNASTFWRDAPLSLGAVELWANRIRRRGLVPDAGDGAGVADVRGALGPAAGGRRGAGLAAAPVARAARALATALAGLYKLAGVDLVRQQVEALLPPSVSSYDVVDEGLGCRTGPTSTPRRSTRWRPRRTGAARVTAGTFPEPLPPLPVVPLLFDRVEVPWDWWVWAWEGDRAGKPHPPLPVAGVRVLP